MSITEVLVGAAPPRQVPEPQNHPRLPGWGVTPTHQPPGVRPSWPLSRACLHPPGTAFPSTVPLMRSFEWQLLSLDPSVLMPVW